MDYTAPLPLNPICCDKVFSYRDRAELCYQEKWLIHSPILKCSVSHFTLSDMGGRNSSKIDPGTKQPHRRRRGWPSKKIPQRVSAAFHSTHQTYTALHGMVRPWIIQSPLNRGNGFKTNVAQYHGRYCYCIVLCNFHKYLSLSSDLPKGMCFNFTTPRSLHLSEQTTRSHIGWDQSDIFRRFSCLCWSVTGIGVESRFIFSQPSDAAQMMFKHPAPRV